ncbi:hypothetical protein TeGR_g11049 [Tetraparma gracilis]|uniref:Uncharacterized protein n=2 Tax=Tetraparma gracilis TaxID=2962635 RepID=A0ABQ6MNL9_9STRA|nr:hypothetical protein TeGR_g11049 [Tetraparma gracilis]
MADKSMEDMDANDFMAAWLRKKEAATSTSSPDLGEIKEILSNLLTGQEEIRARLDTIESQGREKLATDDIICDGVKSMQDAAAEVSGRTKVIAEGIKSWEGEVAKAVENMEAGMQGAMAKTSKGFEDKITGDLADFDKMLKGNLAAGDKMREGIDQVGRSWEGKLTTAVKSMEAGLRSAVTEASKEFQGKIKGKLANYDKLLKDMEKTASGFDLDGKLAGIKEDIKKIAKKAEKEAAEAKRVAGENKKKRRKELLQMGPGALVEAADKGNAKMLLGKGTRRSCRS